jgi:hypothetical protein
MIKTANTSIPANKNAKDFPELSSFSREIGIAAVAAAVRYQRMPASDDNKTKESGEARPEMHVGAGLLARWDTSTRVCASDERVPVL